MTQNISIGEIPKRRKYGIAIGLVGLMVTVGLVGVFAGSVGADSGTLYVNTTGTNDAVTYDSIAAAMQEATNGTVIQVHDGNYTNVSVKVDVKNITVTEYNNTDSDHIRISAENSTYGDAFYGEYAYNLTIDANTTIVEDTVVVDVGGTGDYTSIQTAVNNVANGTTIILEPDVYKTSVNVTAKHIAFYARNPVNNTHKINATGTESGEAFTGPYEDSVRVGANLMIEEEVFAGGGTAIGDSLNDTFLGMPIWAWLLGVTAVVIVYVKEEDNMT